jgi:hypothetical protein
MAGKSRGVRRLARQTRATLLWGAAFFALFHVALLFGTQGRWHLLRDPEFGYKLSFLHKQMDAEPDRPLVVLLGSSRTGEGFRPGVLPPVSTPDGRTPFVFNFSQVGSGPLGELLCLRRLLAEGIRPDWLAIEILPPLLGRKLDTCGNPDVGVSRLTWSDVRLLRQYTPEPDRLARKWYEVQLAPFHAHRFTIMNHYAAEWLPWRKRLDHWKCLDAWGWADMGLDTDHPVKDPRRLELARQTYQEELKQFQIAPMQDQAVRDLLELCRSERIPTVMYLMPEGRIFRSWYLPPTRATIEEYLTRISQEYHVPIVDARNWFEEDYFWDSHHLDRRGATAFTRRFGSDVLPAMVDGQFDAIRPVLVLLDNTYPQDQREQGPLLEARGRPEQALPPLLSINGGNKPAKSPRKSARSQSVP